jgi:arsenate reductase
MGDSAITIFHNPRCSKSRAALALLEARRIKPNIVEYLKTPPSPAELKDILTKLGLRPRQLIRRGEAAYAEAGLDDPTLSDSALIQAMARHPILIERPIVSAGSKAVLGRPPEAILALL